MLRQKTFLISQSNVGFRVTCTAKVTIVSIKPELTPHSRFDEWKVWIKRPRQDAQSFFLKDFYNNQNHLEAIQSVNMHLLCAPYSKVVFEGMGPGDRLHLKVDFECGRQVGFGEVYVPISAEDKYARI